jgi:hypothetical protein
VVYSTGVQPFHGKRPHPLLWAGSRVARAKITVSGVPELLCNFYSIYIICRSQWPCGLRRGSAAARLLGLWVRIPPGLGCLSVVSVVCCQVEVSASG